jgi:hypothetical protein
MIQEVTTMSETPYIENEGLLHSVFIVEMVRQMRAIDSLTANTTSSRPPRLLDPFVLTKEKKQEIPIIGDPDELVVARVKVVLQRDLGHDRIRVRAHGRAADQSHPRRLRTCASSRSASWS